VTSKKNVAAGTPLGRTEVVEERRKDPDKEKNEKKEAIHDSPRHNHSLTVVAAHVSARRGSRYAVGILHPFRSVEVLSQAQAVAGFTYLRSK